MLRCIGYGPSFRRDAELAPTFGDTLMAYVMVCSQSLKNQDTFDHDKGQKSAILGRRLHWRLSTGFFAFSPVFMCNLVR